MEERSKEGRKIGLAILISLFLHLIVGFSLAAFGSASAPAFPIEDKPVELTIVDSPPPDVPKNPPYMETDPAKETKEKPTDQTFESNANSIGASQLPETGDIPMPSQDGKDRPTVDLDTHQYSLEADGAKPQPETQPEAKPKVETAQAAKKPPASAPPVSTAPPLALATPEPEQLAMLTSTPPPAIKPDEAEAEPEIMPESVPPSVPRPKPEVSESRYRAQKDQARINGNLSNRGPSSINAVGTPLGRYQKAVSDAIGSRWYYFIKSSDLASIGTARIHAEVDPEGHLQNLKVVSNSANEAFANVCLQSFQEAKIPPIPEELVVTLPDGRLTVDFSFTLYPNSW